MYYVYRETFLKDHCHNMHNRPPVSKDHIFLAFQCKWTCHQRPPVSRGHILWLMGWSFKRQVICNDGPFLNMGKYYYMMIQSNHGNIKAGDKEYLRSNYWYFVHVLLGPFHTAAKTSTFCCSYGLNFGVNTLIWWHVWSCMHWFSYSSWKR